MTRCRCVGNSHALLHQNGDPSPRCPYFAGEPSNCLSARSFLSIVTHLKLTIRCLFHSYSTLVHTIIPYAMFNPGLIALSASLAVESLFYGALTLDASIDPLHCAALTTFLSRSPRPAHAVTTTLCPHDWSLRYITTIDQRSWNSDSDSRCHRNHHWW